MAGPLFIGCGAGFSGDRTDAAGPVVETLITRLGQRPGARAFLMFETLAERTLALAQLRRRQDPSVGYEPQLEDLLEPVLARCLQHGIGIVGNFGAAHPLAAARAIRALAERLELPEPRIAVVSGDDLSSPRYATLLQDHAGPGLAEVEVVCANAYIGARPIADAFAAGAQIVVAGRVADPSLALGPALAHYGWRDDDWDRLAGGTMAGHLLECGAQVTGGYFADPGLKDVPDLHAVGFPVVEVFEDGSCICGKADGTGGLVSLATVKEQLLYEVHDPAAYLTPDVVADITEATVEQVGENLVDARLAAPSRKWPRHLVFNCTGARGARTRFWKGKCVCQSSDSSRWCPETCMRGREQFSTQGGSRFPLRGRCTCWDSIRVVIRRPISTRPCSRTCKQS
jgi:hypothetical protein